MANHYTIIASEMDKEIAQNILSMILQKLLEQRSSEELHADEDAMLLQLSGGDAENPSCDLSSFMNLLLNSRVIHIAHISDNQERLLRFGGQPLGVICRVILNGTEIQDRLCSSSGADTYIEKIIAAHSEISKVIAETGEKILQELEQCNRSTDERLKKAYELTDARLGKGANVRSRAAAFEALKSPEALFKVRTDLQQLENQKLLLEGILEVFIQAIISYEPKVFKEVLSIMKDHVPDESESHRPHVLRKTLRRSLKDKSSASLKRKE